MASIEPCIVTLHPCGKLAPEADKVPERKMSKSRGRSGTVKVFIADGSRMSCQLIAAALQKSRYRIRVAGYATDTVGILEGLDSNDADVAVIGARLKEGELAGLHVTRQIRARCKTSVITILDSPDPITVVEAFRAGASGVFSRDESFELLCRCIHAVYEGQVWASSKELHFVLDALGAPSQAPTPAPQVTTKPVNLLTKREEGVVHLVAEGLTNRDISRQLNLSEHTVRNYLFRIFNKVGTSTRLELALYAIDRKKADGPLDRYDQQDMAARQSISSARS